jgi:hypothetical protein
VRTIPTRTNTNELDGGSKKLKHSRAKSVKRSKNQTKSRKPKESPFKLDPRAGRHFTSQCRISSWRLGGPCLRTGTGRSLGQSIPLPLRGAGGAHCKRYFRGEIDVSTGSQRWTLDGPSAGFDLFTICTNLTLKRRRAVGDDRYTIRSIVRHWRCQTQEPPNGCSASFPAVSSLEPEAKPNRAKRVRPCSIARRPLAQTYPSPLCRCTLSSARRAACKVWARSLLRTTTRPALNEKASTLRSCSCRASSCS